MEFELAGAASAGVGEGSAITSIHRLCGLSAGICVAGVELRDEVSTDM